MASVLLGVAALVAVAVLCARRPAWLDRASKLPSVGTELYVVKTEGGCDALLMRHQRLVEVVDARTVEGENGERQLLRVERLGDCQREWIDAALLAPANEARGGS